LFPSHFFQPGLIGCFVAIVEQATHFCDLSRFFGGEVDHASVMAHTVEHDERPGGLSAKGFDEDVIPPENRIPRLTSAVWKYESGAVGSLMHAVALQGNTRPPRCPCHALPADLGDFNSKEQSHTILNLKSLRMGFD
jgi:predicted dehydrogenase